MTALRNATRTRFSVNECEKYQHIYSRPQEWPKYGRGNHGKDLIPIFDWRPIRKVLDVGCGHQMFRAAMRYDVPHVHVFGVDIACPSADVIAPAHELPFPDREFDLVGCFDVLEHVRPGDVMATLLEFRRVAPFFAFSICHNDSKNRVNGETLHPTVRPKEWWHGKIREAGGVFSIMGKYIAGEWR